MKAFGMESYVGALRERGGRKSKFKKGAILDHKAE
jgi:hypothetical protein